MSKLLEPKPDYVRNPGNAWREHLAQIVPEKVPASVEQALSPEFLNFANGKLIEGKALSEIMRLLGLSRHDARWRAMRKALIQQALPENESEALLSAYDEQEDMWHRMEELLREVDAKLEETPKTEEELKAHHNYYKYKFDILKQMVQMRGDRFQQYMDIKRLTKGSAGKLAVQIVIQNNVPRPEKKIQEIEAKVLGEE